MTSGKGAPLAPGAADGRSFTGVDQALEWVERRLLAEAGMTGPGTAVSLADSDLGRSLGGADLDILRSEAPTRSVDAGAELWRAGDRAGSMFLPLEGMLIACHDGYRLASFGPGAIVGEIGFLTGEPRSATVLADAPSSLLEIIDLDALSRARDRRPSIARWPW